MDKWHLGRSGQTFGPYPWAQIVEMARAGQIVGADMLWQEGTSGWVPASSLADRLPLARGGAAPPPLPPTSTTAPGGDTGAKLQKLGKGIGFHAGRATAWNLHEITVTEEETKELLARGVDDDDARKYHAWRRSVLKVTFWGGIVAGTLGTIAAAAADHKQLSDFGSFLEFARVATLWLIPVFALRASRAWLRHKRSRRLLGIGWTIAFATPLLLGLVPVHWRYTIEDQGEMRAQAEAMLRLLGAIGSYITLMPAVLALIPGIMRACLRVKILLPQSILPGWFLVSAAPFWTFLFFVVFVTINQAAGDVTLVIGILLITGGPVLYLVHQKLFTRPILTMEDRDRMLKVQKQVRIILSAGVVFLLIWLFTASVFGRKIIGVDAETSLVRPWSLDLFQFPVEFGTHSLFTMALAADLFMAMNLSVWQYTKQFVASPDAKDYDRRMAEIDEAGEKD